MWIDGELTLLGGLYSDTTPGKAFDINDAGHAVGWSYTEYEQRAFYWADGVMRPLAINDEYNQQSGASGINDNDEIVGWISYMGGTHAALWQDGVLLDINDLVTTQPGWTLTEAWSINDSGLIVANESNWDTRDSHIVVLVPVPEPSSILVVLCGVGGLGLLRRKKP